MLSARRRGGKGRAVRRRSVAAHRGGACALLASCSPAWPASPRRRRGRARRRARARGGAHPVRQLRHDPHLPHRPATTSSISRTAPQLVSRAARRPLPRASQRALRIGVDTRFGATLDNSSSLIVDGERCPILSLVRSAEPPPPRRATDRGGLAASLRPVLEQGRRRSAQPGLDRLAEEGERRRQQHGDPDQALLDVDRGGDLLAEHADVELQPVALPGRADTCAPAGRWPVRLPILPAMRRFASAAPRRWGRSTLIGARSSAQSRRERRRLQPANAAIRR